MQLRKTMNGLDFNHIYLNISVNVQIVLAGLQEELLRIKVFYLIDALHNRLLEILIPFVVHLVSDRYITE